MVAAHQVAQGISDDFDDMLPGRQTFEDIPPHGLSPNAIDEVFDNVEIDIGFEQRQTDLFQRLGHVLFLQDTGAPEFPERAFKFAGQCGKHEDPVRFEKTAEKPFSLAVPLKVCQGKHGLPPRHSRPRAGIQNPATRS